MNYSEFQNLASSEKIVLATLDASKRLMGWELESGSVYFIEDFNFPKVVRIEDSGVAYTEAANVGAVTAGKYFHDRTNKRIYLRASDSSNPNSKFIVIAVRFYFSNNPIVLPHDFDEGYEVFFEPLIQGNSDFGVEIDTINNSSEAIEGSGTLSLRNDFDFWPANFDKLSFENQDCYLYSYNRELNLDQLKKLFRGKIYDKKYSNQTISFQVRDQLAKLADPIPLETIGDLEERTPTDLSEAKQRMILGRVFGMRPTNIDQVLTGYPITGTVSVSVGSSTVTGSGTSFLAEVSPDDEILIEGTKVVVATVASDTSLTISKPFDSNVSASGSDASVIPKEPKRWINRVFKVAGHAVREPVTATQSGSTISRLYLDSTDGIYNGDQIYIGSLGSGELATVRSVIGSNYVRLATSLANSPAIGTEVRRPAVQSVRIDDLELVYYRDYTFDADTAILTLDEEAEANISPVYSLGVNMVFTNSSRTVTGTGFDAFIRPGYLVSVVGETEYFEVLSVDSDTQLTLRTAATFTDTDIGRYKSFVYDEGTSVLSLDCLGRTVDGTTTGVLVDTAPGITKLLLNDLDLEDDIEESQFDDAEEIAYQSIGLIVPESFNDTDSITYREVLNKINKSVFGSLIQTSDFKLGYHVLRPRKGTATTRFSEADILKFSLEATNKNTVKTVTLEYLYREYDYLVKKEMFTNISVDNDKATYVLKTDKIRTVRTYLVNQNDAEIMTNRWSFLLSNSTSRLQLTTKLQGSLLEIGNVIEIEHRKMFERFGSTSKSMILMVESVKRDGSNVEIEATDLSNTFSRVACITSQTNDFVSASETEKLYGGYITDQYGLIDNSPETFETNLIW